MALEDVDVASVLIEEHLVAVLVRARVVVHRPFSSRRATKSNHKNGMLRQILERAIMFLSLWHFISLDLNYCPACKSERATESCGYIDRVRLNHQT